MPSPGPQRAQRLERRLLLLLLVAYGWLFVFFPKLNNPNELVRVYMARAIAEEGTYAIGRRERAGAGFADTGRLHQQWGYVNDKSLVCDDPRAQAPACAGTLYSGKAPGVSLLAAPFVWAQNELTRRLAGRAPSKDELVLALRWLLAILPTLALWAWVRRWLRASGVDAPVATAAVLAGALGSLSYTFGQMVAGHQLAAVCLGLAFAALFWPEEEGAGRRAALGGLLCALSVLVEYQSAPAAALLLAGWVWVRRPPLRLLAAGAAGALPPALLFAHFHWRAYGAPWRTGYSFLENAGFVRDIAPGFLGISPPDLERFWGVLFAPWLGLFHWAPWTALALGALPLLRRGAPVPADPGAEPARRAGQVAGLVVLYYLLFQLNHALWRSGWTVGPRYIAPLVPFAAIALALALQRLRADARVAGLALLAGSAVPALVATVLASAVCQGFPPEAYNPLREAALPLWTHGWTARNPLQALGVPGPWSALPVLLALALACALLLASPLALARLRTKEIEAPALAAARATRLAWLLALGLSLAQWTAMAGATPEGRRTAAFLASQWTPERPPGARDLP